MRDGVLLLESGKTYQGRLETDTTIASGEVVFTTGMTGYVEALTDPSFAGQLLVFTYPLIGNYGVVKQQLLAPHLSYSWESERIWVSGVLVSEASKELITWFNQQHIACLSGIDTRSLTLLLREQGVMKGQIAKKHKTVNWPSLIVESNAVEITTPVQYEPVLPNGKKLAVIDCGMKHGILRALLERGFSLTRYPWQRLPTSFSEFDGVVCSNGPGDPKDYREAIKAIRATVLEERPFLGICLGHQLLALAIGADTYKLPYGHRGLNQPCQDLLSKKAYITSQNHGYAVATDTIPKEYQAWFSNLHDQTNEGLRHRKLSIGSVQFHPEGQPGPHDTDWVFDWFNL